MATLELPDSWPQEFIPPGDTQKFSWALNEVERLLLQHPVADTRDQVSIEMMNLIHEVDNHLQGSEGIGEEIRKFLDSLREENFSGPMFEEIRSNLLLAIIQEMA
jgi:hypothetical protein